MEHLSKLLLMRCVPWQGLLLTASLLTFWHQSTMAETTLQSIPSLIMEAQLPDPTIVADRTTAVEDEHTVELRCDPSVPNAKYIWKLNNRDLRISNRLTYTNGNRTVTFNKISRHYGGSFHCEYTTPDGRNRRSQGRYVKVYYGPDTPIITPETEKYTIGETMNLRCQTVSYPSVQYIWFFENDHLNSSREVNLENVNETHSGTYNCTVYNERTNRRSSKAKYIKVGALLPDPTIVADRTTAVEDEHTVELRCDPIVPNATYIWQLNNKDLRMSDRLSFTNGNSTLTFNKISRHYGGSFHCEYTAPDGTNRRSQSRYVNVYYGPDIPAITPETEKYKEGEMLNLRCHSVSFPSIQYTWFFENDHLNSSREVNLENVNETDSGLYNCTVYNNDTNRRNSKAIYIKVGDERSRFSARDIAIMVAQCLAILLVLIALLCLIMRRRRKRPPPPRQPPRQGFFQRLLARLRGRG